MSGVDPLSVESWITGWALARGTPPPARDGSAFRVDVGWPEQRARYVFPRLGEEVRRLVERVSEPWVYLKVCASPDDVRALLPVRWSIMPSSYFMIAPSDASGTDASVPAGYALDTTDAAVSSVRILSETGDVAASGHVAIVGAYAIYDRIETEPDHQRRGLGRAVMAALGSLARTRGATQGLLVATVDGRALYERLGWRVASPYTSAVITGDLNTANS